MSDTELSRKSSVAEEEAESTLRRRKGEGDGPNIDIVSVILRFLLLG